MLESRRAYLIQAIKVNDVTRERLLVMGTGMAAKELIAQVQQAHICNTLSKWNADLAVERRIGMELADELGSIQKMVRESSPFLPSNFLILIYDLLSVIRWIANAVAFNIFFSRVSLSLQISSC